MEQKNLKKALSSPASVFANPQEVVDEQSMSSAQKREILMHWQAEAIHLQESSAEGFSGGEHSDIDAINKALQQLEGDPLHQ